MRNARVQTNPKPPQFSKYCDDPVGFARNVLRFDPWERQGELLKAAAEHPRVACRSGHKTGKSASAGCLALWWVCTRPRGLVVLTSSSFDQISSILWPEIRKLYQQAGGDAVLGGQIYKDPGSGLQFSDGRWIYGRSTNKSERMAGISGSELLFIIDEASGIEESIFEAIEGNRAGGARAVLLGNPTQTSGEFYAAFHEKRQFYHTVHISSEETPNVKAGKMLIPGLATADWVAEKLVEWGRDSPLFDVRVAGNFPCQGPDTIIGLALVESAAERWKNTEGEGRLEIGVDVARFGDDESVVQPVRGLKALEPTMIQSMDTVFVAGKVLEIAHKLRKPNEVPRIKVDGIGIGAGVVDMLRQSKDVEVAEVNVSESAYNDDYANLRSELWFGARDWLKSGGAIPPNAEKLKGELVAPKYGFTPRGKIVVEPKDQIKKRLKRSPDCADALCLAVHAARNRKRSATYIQDSSSGDCGYRM